VTKHHIKVKRNTEPSCCLNHSSRWRWWSAPHSRCYNAWERCLSNIIYVSGFTCHYVSKISQ